MEPVVARTPPRPARTRLDLDRIARALLLAFGLAFLISLASAVMSPTGSSAVGGRLGGDFPAFYGAGRIVAAGDAAHLYDTERQALAQRDLFGDEPDGGYLYFAYPPAFAALYAPLAELPYEVAYALHTVVMVGALVGALWAIRPMVRLVREHFTIVLAGALTFYPAFRAVTAGQNTALMLLALALSWRFVDRERDLAAGVVLGLAIAKPQLAIALVGLHLLARRWRVVAGAALGAGAVWAVGALLAGVGWLGPWWEQATRFERIDAAVNGQNAISWLGVGKAVAGVDSLPAAILGWSLAALSVAAIVWTWRHAPRRALGPAMAVAAAGVLVIAPHAMFYDAGLLVLTGLVLADRLGRPGRLVLVGAWAVAFAHPLAPTLGVTPVALAVVVVFTIAVIEARRPPLGAPPTPRGHRREGAPDLSVVIPAFDEERRLGPTLDRVAAWVASQPGRVEVVVVDDGSTDGTASVAAERGSALPDLRILRLGANCGKGHAVRAGMLAANGNRRLFMDADNATDLSELDRLDESTAAAAVVIGSIAVPGAEVVVPQPAARRLLGRVGNLVIRLAVLPGVRDSQRGFKVFDGQAADEIFSLCVIDGWGFDVEVLGIARVLGYEVHEVGVRWSHQEHSRVRPTGYVTTLLEVIRIQARLLRLAASRTLRPPVGGAGADLVEEVRAPG